MRACFYILLLCLGVLNARAQQAPEIDQAVVMNYFQDQQYTAAIAYLQSRIQPDNIRQLALLGYACYLAGKWPDAIHTYQQLLQLDSTYIPAHQYLGSIYMQQEQPALAIPHYRTLAALQPQAGSYKQLSFAFFAAREADSGFVYLQQAYALNPFDSKVVARMAEEWLDRERYNAADSVLQPYLAKDSLQTSVLIPAVKTAYFLKDYPQAIALGQRLMRQQVISITACSFVAAACYYAKRYQECIYVNDFLTQADMNTETIMYYAAMACTQLKDYTRSNQLLQQCIDLAKSKSLDDYYTAMGANYEGLHAYTKATACLDTAYYLFKAPLRQYSIGRIYDHYLQKPAAAQRYYRRYLQLARTKEHEPAVTLYVRQRLKEMQGGK
jgi:tetratricopeptide (TPR) repeat protein